MKRTLSTLGDDIQPHTKNEFHAETQKTQKNRHMLTFPAYSASLREITSLEYGLSRLTCRYSILFAVTFFFFAHHAVAQDALKRFATAGALTGLGTTFSDNTGYKVYYLMGDWSWSFSKQPKKNDFVGWYCDPQFNFVKATNISGEANEVEFGVNLGIRNYVRINNNLYLYQMLGSGPHYITAHLVRQAHGFIFSDNLAVGSFIRVSDSKFLNLQFGIRHISNANIELPNRGVNSWNVMIGLSGIR